MSAGQEQPVAAMPPVLIYAPGRDGELSCQVLARAGIDCHRCTNEQDLLSRLCDGASALLVAEEALVGMTTERIRDAVRTQPPWSDLPVFVVTMQPSAGETLHRVQDLGNVAVLTRPMSPGSLTSAVSLAIRARRRQHEVRDLLRSQQEQARRKDEFLAMLAHELRNPLAPVRYAAHMIQAAELPRDKRVVIAGLVEKQVAHMSSLIEQLLDVTRVNRGIIALESQPLDLRDVAGQSCEAHGELAAQRGIQLTCDTTRSLPVMGDPTRLKQVCDNLLDNAIKYSFPGGSVRVSLAEEAGWAVLQVRDEGDGISAADLPSIFEAFVQGDHSLDRSGGGLGLGLSMVKGLVELHGGSVTAASPGKGQGSTFTVSLPLLRAPSDRPDGPGVAGTTGTAQPTTLDVLVVEDNRDAAETLRMILEMEGHRVTVAHAGDLAVELAQTLRVNVIICDIGLPGLDGYAVARTLRRSDRHRSTFMVAVTGYGDPESHVKALEAGFDEHMVKPLQAERLLDLLGALPASRRCPATAVAAHAPAV